MNIQNSLELTDSSFLGVSIDRYWRKNRNSEIPKKVKMKAINCHSNPISVKACTEVSPSIPLRVRNVEYTMSTKVSK